MPPAGARVLRQLQAPTPCHLHLTSIKVHPNPASLLITSVGRCSWRLVCSRLASMM